MSALPVFLSCPDNLLRDSNLPQPLSSEETLSSERLLNGRREILISHGDRVYRLRHTSNDKLILTK